MRVETVSFIVRIRLPDGRHETTISMQNQHQRLSYEVDCDPKTGILTIKSIKSPSWVVLVPLTNCAFIVLAKANAGVKKTKAKTPRTPSDTPPMTPVVRKRARPRIQKE